MPSAQQPVEWVALGNVSGVFGIKGWVKVYSHTRPREGILTYRHWYLGDEHRHVEVAGGRLQGGGVVARLAGCANRDDAEALVGQGIAVAREALNTDAPDEYLWRDLIGLAVRNTDGEELGRISGIMETGANDVLVLAGERERLVPFTGEVVREVDLAGGRMVVEWEGDF